MFGRKTLLQIFGMLVFAATVSSCSNTKHLPKDDTLYIGARVNIKDNEVTKRTRKVLNEDLEDAVRPRPNSKILGVRLKLTIYNMAGDTSKRGFIRNTLRKFGEPPVLASTLDLQKNNDLFVNVMENRGFFYPKVQSHTDTRKKKTRAIFDVWTGPQYTIRNVVFPVDSMQLSQDIAATKDETLLKAGAPYNLTLIKGERDRITKALTEQGYYYFNSDYLLAKVDSTVGTHNVDIYVTPKYMEMPPQAFHRYYINDVFVYPNYRLNGNRKDTSMANAAFHNGYYVVDNKNSYRPVVFEQAMQFKPGDLYNRTEQNMALSRLVSLGTFKFVKNRFDPIDDLDSPRLDVYYYLTPYTKKSIRFEIGVQSQSDSRLGTTSSITWRNRNTFRGAEQLSIKLRGGYESQAGGNVQRPALFEGGADVDVTIPRFIVPFFKIVPSSMYIPRTIIGASYDLSARQNLYLIHSIKGSYGYQFKEDIRKEHKFFPININYVRTDTIAPPTEATINYSNIIFNGLIIGPSYEYTFNSQAAGLNINNYYFNGLADLSNNILGLVQGASQEHPKQIFGTTYAQYIKLQADGRYYWNYAPINKNNIWANRIILGFGYPWGNSRQLPNIKQFFAGGASSLRGFPSRLVGPGTFNERYLYGDVGQPKYVEMLGDIKLEINTEYRANLYQFLNGAVFFDAGNIWTYYDDPRFPGGQFTSNFYKELAVDGGIGLRLDFNVVLLRLDLGIPLRKPWLPEGQRWVLDKVDFGSSSWRNENLIFNLAIGYPF